MGLSVVDRGHFTGRQMVGLTAELDHRQVGVSVSALDNQLRPPPARLLDRPSFCIFAFGLEVLPSSRRNFSVPFPHPR
jgi:hypothetical protein